MGPAGAEALNVCPWTLEFGDTFKDGKNTLGSHSNLTELVIRLQGGIWFPRQKVQLRVKSRAAEGSVDSSALGAGRPRSWRTGCTGLGSQVSSLD